MVRKEKVYIVPDIHGRRFWHDVEKLDEYDKIIFLGDYVDPYTDEGLHPEEGLKCLKEVIQFAMGNDKVVLLMGNHDSTYMISTDLCECRTDYDNFPEISELFLDNKDMFRLAYCLETEQGPVMFTHAGLFSTWLDDVYNLTTDERDWTPNEIADHLNRDFQDLLTKVEAKDKRALREDKLYRGLMTVSYMRGGWGDHGSCIWSDIREHLGGRTLPFFQIVGHTMINEGKILKLEHIACVDSQKVWRLDEVFDAPLSR